MTSDSATLGERMGRGFLLFLRVFFVVFLVLPFLVAVPVSFSPAAVFPSNGFTFRWYEAFATSETFNAAWRVSLVVALVSGLLSTFAGTLMAVAITRYRFRGRSTLIAVTFSPLMVPGVAIGIGLVFLFASIGLLDSWVRLVLAHVIVATPYSLRVVGASLQGFDTSLEEAAMNLGASYPRALWTVTLPIVRSAAAAAFLFAFITSIDNLSVTVFVAQPGFYTIPVVLFGYVRDKFDPIVAVATVVMMIIAAIALYLMEKIIGLERFTGLDARSSG